MSKRTRILLDDDICQRLVSESLKRYKTTKALSKVANELSKGALKSEAKVLDLVFSEKLAKTSAREFEAYRRQLSKRFES